MCISLLSSHAKLLVMAGMVMVFILSVAGNISAATFVVTNTNDSGPGSLRQAIFDARANGVSDVINFDPAVFSTPRTIILTTGEFVLSTENTDNPITDLTINGPGANLLTISGNNQSRIFAVQWPRRLSIDGMTLTGGNGVGIGTGFQNNGGAILVDSCSGDGEQGCLTIKNSVITGNHAQDGGGIYVPGYSTIQNSAVVNNTATRYGGGIHSSYIRVANCTITGNTAVDGGGMYIGYHGNIYLTHATITANTANIGGGIGTDSYYMATGSASAKNSIISGNTTTQVVNGDSQYVGYYDPKNNIMNTPFPNPNPGNGNQVNVNPKIGDMRLNSTGIPYFTLKADSPAVDKGNNCVLIPIANGGCEAPALTVADIRGVARPQDGDGNGTATVDVGAFEISSAEFELTPGKPDLATADDSGVSTTDNITSARTLHMQVGNLTPGATVKVYRNGVVIQTFTVAGTSTEITDSNLPADGNFAYYATQTVNGPEGLAGATLDVTVDNTRPGSTLYQPSFQSDPVRELPVRFVIGFTEPIIGLTSSDISLNSSTANVSGATVNVMAALPSYVIWVSGTISAQGQIIATMAENTVIDLAGNPNTASTYMDNSITFDNVGPVVTINQAASQPDPTASGPINFTVTFNEPAFGFGVSDISLTGSTANVSAATVSITGSGTTFNVAVGNVTSSGTVRASIPANRVQDSLGNSNSASTSTDNTVTYNSKRALFDYDGDGKSDVSVFRPSNNNWYILPSLGGLSVQGFGTTGDILAPADFDGDGKTDLAIFRPSTGTWWYKSSINAGFYAVQFGANGDIPLPQDFTGDGKADFVFFRPSDSAWYRLGSDGQFSALTFGIPGDIPLVADMDGDGKTDPTVYRPSTGTWWYASSINGGYYAIQWGTASDIPVPADYDGDGRTDAAYFRPSTGSWLVLYSSTGYSTYTATAWGTSGDRPVAADYDGDGKADLAIYRPSNGMWFVVRSFQGNYGVNFGDTGDLATPAAFVP